MNRKAFKNYSRRGNALILVIGILVLLVLVATAFITKTQSGRATAVAQRDSAQIDDRASTIHKAIADEVAIALFPRTLAATFEASANSANARRVAPSQFAPRYGHDPKYPFNFAPYEVVPWTNPPDDDTIVGIPLLGPHNPIGGPSFGDSRWLRDTEPQRADIIDFTGQGIAGWADTDGTPETFTHWRHLTNMSRSGNALRIVKDISDVTGLGPAGPLEPPAVVVDLDVPVEQWPAFRPQRGSGWQGLGVSLDMGYPSLIDGGYSNYQKWKKWGTLPGWAAAQLDPTELPQNYLDLSDLNGDGVHNDPDEGERPFDAFVRGTNRWHTERWITDTDGDGFTDALWHLYPQNLGPDTKQIIAVSVTDNSARGNMNVATQFQRKDYYNTDSARDRHGEATKGHTPADLAIIGQNDFSFGNVYPWRVGFMDNLANLPGLYADPWVTYNQIGPNGSIVTVDWDTGQWQNKDNASLLDELGIEVNETFANPVFNDNSNVLNQTDDVNSRYGRLWYWQLAGRDPFSATNGFRPFTIADELELRFAEGNNYQFIGSRFERSVNQIIGDNNTQFLRSNYNSRHEASEYRDQLDNRQMLFDNRRKLTMFSGSRNDLLPPWLRWEDRFWNRHDPEALGVPSGYDSFDIDAYETSGIPDDLRPAVYGSTFPIKVAIEGINAVINNVPNGLDNAVLSWREQSRTKLDLREYYPGDFLFPDPNEEYWWESNTDGRLTFSERLPLQLLLAMTDSQEQGVSSLGSTNDVAHAPLGTFDEPNPDGDWASIGTNYYQQARLAAAGLSSNILTYRDEDMDWRQHSVLPYYFNSTARRKDLPLSQAVTPPLIGRQSNDGLDPIWGVYVPFADANIAGPNELAVELLGLEAQPFITEVFLAHVHQATEGGDHWACCLETGGCEDVSEETCEGLLGGTFFDGDLCDPNGDGNLDDSPCPDQGACCLDSGGCLYTNQIDCEALEATYQGDGVSCAEDPCFGACCVDGIEASSGEGQCLDISASSCGLLGAAFAGFNTECASTQCTPQGACCFDSATCMDTLSAIHCASLGGTFEFGVFCVSKPCKVGACCISISFGACVEVSQSTCRDLFNGQYHGTDSLCFSNPCTLAGACCLSSGSCIDALDAESCNVAGGTFVAGAACVDGSLLTSSIAPTEDAWLSESDPNTANGDLSILLIGEDAAGNREHVVLEYVIDPEIESGNISNAVIVFDYEQFLGTNSTVRVARLTQSWDSAATWNTHNGANGWPGGGGAGGDADEVLDVQTFTVGTSGDVKIHVETMAQDAIENHDSVLSLVIYKTVADGSESNTQFSSRDSIVGSPPTLTIQYSIGADPCASACCLNVNVCETVSNATCDDLGGTYTAGVTCAAGACSGACCFATGGCEVMSQESCDANFTATFSGPGTSCSIDQCGIEGACCLQYTPDEIWLNELLYDNSPVWVNEFQYDTVDSAWVNELHYDNFIAPWINEFQYDTVDSAWVNEFHYDNFIPPWINEFQYDTVDSVWLNEIHYDNIGADVNEFVEIALDSYIDPATVTVLLYDGATGLVYNTLAVNTFAVGEVQDGKTIYSLVLPLDGLQNDIEGVAIVINGTVEQFISYEGTFVATDGAANGLPSVNYGISEAVPIAAGGSIGIDGTGSNFSDFTPAAFNPNTVGFVNAGQDITENELLEIALDSEIDPGATTVEVLLYNGADGTVYNTLNLNTFTVGSTTAGITMYTTLTTLQEDSDGIAVTVSGILQRFISYEGAFVATDGPATGVGSDDVVLTQTNGSPTQSIGYTGTGGQPADFTWGVLAARTIGTVNTGQTIVNIGEFVEIALDKYIDPSAVVVQVLLYDGANGTVYNTLDVDIDFSTSGIEEGGKLFYSSPVFTGDGLQDGPDGIAIVIDGVVEQFISYEGTFVATGGAADGETSEDYGIEETNVVTGSSIGLIGTGSDYDDFTPAAFGVHSNSLVNVGQQIDENELIEIAIDSEIDPGATTVEVLLYNGADGTVYNTLNLNTFTVGATTAGITMYTTLTTLQDDSEGIAITITGILQRFISYEGAFLATDGPATGLGSDDVVLTQTNGSATESIGYIGTGGQPADFTWRVLGARTIGLVNTGQTIENIGEFVEIALDSYIDPATVTVLLYDGATGLVYNTLAVNTFAVGEVQGGKTIYSLVLPLDGLRDGLHGIAIVIDGDVEQFVSFEGTFVATGGAADGETSEDYGIEETNVVTGSSIGLIGTGSDYDDFTPAAFGVHSNSLVNVGQQIIENELIEIALDVEIDPLVDTVQVLLYSGVDGTVYNTLDLSTFTSISPPQEDMRLFYTLSTLRDGNDGIAITINGVLKQFISYEGEFLADSGDLWDGELSDNFDIEQADASSLASIGLTGAAAEYSEFDQVAFVARSPGIFNLGQTITSYDEFIEIAVSTNVKIGDVTIELYGSAGFVYATLGSADMSPGESQGDMNIYFADWSEDFLANGPAAIAIVYDGEVVGAGPDRQFLYYEGTIGIRANDGAAVGMTSDKIPIPLNVADVGTSIGLIGAGSYYSDFGWAEFATNSMGDFNAGQTIVLIVDSEVCIDVSETACSLLDGDFQGKNITCGEVPCGEEIIRGACCFDTGACEDIDSATCHELEGVYQGDGVSCLDAPCVADGACCLESTSCLDLNQSTCEDLSGTFHLGELCSDSPCSGACCLPDGACTDTLNQSDCESQSGTYRVATTCENVPCVGACCVGSATCVRLSEITCVALFGGTFEGFGITCSTDPCVIGLPGACCVDGGGGCTEVLQAVCTSLAGVYSGDSSTCQAVSCLIGQISGACCLPTTTCVDVTAEKICTDIGGTYQGDTTSCADNLCTGGCCLSSGSCLDTIEAGCDAMGGTFVGLGTACSTTPCRTACCLSSGSCIDVKMLPTCENLNGTFVAFGSTCETAPCTGACCTYPVGCEIISAPSCSEIGGAFNGLGTLCVGDPCVSGSCCLDSGTCVETTQGTCDAFFAGFWVEGALCDVDPCLGACCLWSGGCELLSIETCKKLWDPDGTLTAEEDDQPGFWNGFGSVCGPLACTPTGSCCLPSGSCVDITDVNTGTDQGFVRYCDETLGGKYRVGVFCSDALCAAACCLPSGCENLPEETCSAVGGDYQGGSYCEDAPCDLGTCCFDSGSCLELTEDSCEDYFGGTWADGELCDPDGIPNSGDEPCTRYFIVKDDLIDCPQETIAVVQLTNPFDREIDLNDYAVELFGQDYKLEGLNRVLPPGNPVTPATLILYSLPEASTIADPSLVHDFNTDWLDFLDLEIGDHPITTVIVPVPNIDWSTERTYYDELQALEQNSVALYKFDGVEGVNRQRVLVDRLDPPNSSETFDERVVTDLEKEWLKVGDDGYVTVTDRAGEKIPADTNTSALFVQWDRATRAWSVDIPDTLRYDQTSWHNGVVDSWEKNPRFVFSARDFIRSDEVRIVANPETSPPTGDIYYSSGFKWTDPTDPLDPDDLDGDGNPDSTDDDLLPDNPDPWIVVEVWSPRAGIFRPDTTVEGEVQGGLRFRKPTYFDMNYQEDPLYILEGDRSFADKGWYGQTEDADNDKTTSDTPAFEDADDDEFISVAEIDMALAFSMQMLQKDADFEQVGEVMNCWLFGHMVEGTHSLTEPDSYLNLPLSALDAGGDAIDAGTIVTFSEFMYPRWDTQEDWWAPWVATVEDDKVVLSEGVNRLRYLPQGDMRTPLMMDGRSDLDEFLTATARNHPWPRLPIASRVLDSFVCDGPGRPDHTGDGVGDDLHPAGNGFAVPSIHSFYNANGFSGKATPGIININTAPVEVLRMLPHMYKVVHETNSLDSPALDAVDRNPRSLIPEAMIQWREEANGYSDVLLGSGFTGGPDYSNRSAALNMTYGVGPKHTRGFSSPSEIGMLQVPGFVDDVIEPWHISDKHNAVRDASAWKIDFARLDPFGYIDGTAGDYSVQSIAGEYVGTPISTEVNHNTYYDENTLISDGVSGDAEEWNLLQAGISNLIGTTSDMFTVHMRIRTFKRNPITGIWDATDLDYIVDDSRYVMLVDRSNVESSADEPRILYFEKLPN